MKEFKDRYGNSISITNQTVKLFLKDENRPRGRRLGKLGKNTLYVYRNEAKHLHRLSNSYGFNYELLKVLPIESIKLNVNNGKTYLIPTEFLMEYGKILFFKQQGFEKQIFINIDLIKKFEKNHE